MKKDFQIQEKQMQIEALNQQKADISLLKNTSYKAIQNFQKIYELKNNLGLNNVIFDKTHELGPVLTSSLKNINKNDYAKLMY